jgi:hypothetical protein
VITPTPVDPRDVCVADARCPDLRTFILTSDRVTVLRGRTARVRLSCFSNPPRERCRGTLRVRTVRKLRAPGARRAKRHVLATVRFDLPPGDVASTVRVRFDKRARRLLAKHKRVAVQLRTTTISPAGTRTREQRTATLRRKR